MSAATTALAGTVAVFFTGLGTAKIRAVPAMRQPAPTPRIAVVRPNGR